MTVGADGGRKGTERRECGDENDEEGQGVGAPGRGVHGGRVGAG